MATHYETLGVSENASIDDIKKAYRKLAMKYHPDQNQGNQDAEAKFKEISVAYDAISTPEKKADYDRKRTMQHDHGNWSFNFTSGGHPDLEDILNQMFNTHGFAKGHRAPNRNRDVNLSMEITLEDAFNGKSVPVKFRTPGGRDGEIMANIPAGIDSGIRVRYQGQGENSNMSAPPGDLYIQVIVKDHPIFQRQANDLHSIIEVDAISAIVGTKHRMKCIDEKTIDIVIPAGTQSGAYFRVVGQGMPLKSSKMRGDLILHVKIKVPTILSSDQLDQLAKIQKERGLE